MLPIPEIIIIGLCCWAIALERRLRDRDKDVSALCTAIASAADGRAVIVRENNKITIKPVNRGE